MNSIYGLNGEISQRSHLLFNYKKLFRNIVEKIDLKFHYENILCK